MPTAKLTGGWRDQAPPGFSYTLKAPRRITHEQKLKGSEDTLRFFTEAARVLEAHLGALLFQLPPTFKADPARLDGFLKLMPSDLRTAFEFRHDSWLTDEVFGLLTSRKAALCIADFGDKTTPLHATARHGYFRLRDEGYQPADLDVWADRVAAQAGVWDDAFVYFKHEEEGKGPEFARAFLDRLATRTLTP
jgi:uncharacterized protein YecE (DUF72 family)